MRYALVILFLLLWPFPVQSDTAEQPNNFMCEARSKALENIKDNYGETLVAYGLDIGGRLVEIYQNPETKTWTMLLSFTKEISCLVGVGTKLDVLEKTSKKCARSVNGT